MSKDSLVNQNTTRNLYVQGGFLIFSQIVVRVINLLFRIPVTNLWGDHGLGIYSDAYEVYAFFLVFASTGVPTIVSKMVSERLATNRGKDARKVFFCTMRLLCAMGLVCMLIMIFGSEAIAVHIFNDPEAARPIAFLGPTVLLCSVLSVLRGYFQGMNNMKPTSLSEVLEGILHAVFAVVLAFLLIGRGIDWSVCGAMIGTFIGAVGGILVLCFYYAAYQREDLAGKQETPVEETKDIYRQFATLFFPIILSSTIFSIKSLLDASLFGKLMIADGCDPEEVVSMRGIYSGKFVVLVNVPIAIGQSLGTAAVPSIAAGRAVGDYSKMREQFRSMLRTVLFITIPFAIGYTFMGKPVLRLLFHATYLGGDLFWVGSFAIVFYSVAYISGGILNGLNKPHLSMIHSAIGVVVTELLFTLNIRVFHLGIYALPLNMLSFSAFIMIFNTRSALRLCRMRVDFWELSRGPLLSSLLMAVFCVAFYVLTFAITGSNAAAVVVSVLLSILFYFTFTINTGIVHDAELDQIPGGRYLRKLRFLHPSSDKD